VRVVLFMLGYRFGEVLQKKLPPVKDGVTLTLNPKFEQAHFRPVVSTTLGCYFVGAALPHVDPTDLRTAVAGVSKRVASRLPEPAQGVLDELGLFVLKFCQRYFVPLDAHSDFSVESWLLKTSYSKIRQAALLKKWNEVLIWENLKPKHFLVDQFIKDENYPEFKYARQINSRADEFKCATGPIFRCIEKEVFKLKWFVKNVPVAERPRYITDLLEISGSKYQPTDYTSFEAMFTRELMHKCEFVLYDHMLTGCSVHDQFLEMIDKALAGVNVMKNPMFTLKVKAMRMSGEMNTSLGNGFTNAMISLFLAHKHGVDLAAVFEGDDGLMNTRGRLMNESDYASVGTNVKVDTVPTVNEAGFCGMVFDPVDMCNVTDVRAEIVSFGWSKSKYVRSSEKTKLKLLRCKSFSMAHQYPGCPILGALARFGLRVTKSIDVRFMAKRLQNTYEREQLFDALACPPAFVPVGMNSRLLVERLYGVSVETQLFFESYLDSLQQLLPLQCDKILDACPKEWKDYYDDYVVVPKFETAMSFIQTQFEMIPLIVKRVMPDGTKVRVQI